jgi:hypothetical protein
VMAGGSITGVALTAAGVRENRSGVPHSCGREGYASDHRTLRPSGSEMKR